jgi:hypothetical protein
VYPGNTSGTTTGFLDLNFYLGVRASISLADYSDFANDEKCLRALEKLYLRVIECNQVKRDARIAAEGRVFVPRFFGRVISKLNVGVLTRICIHPVPPFFSLVPFTVSQSQLQKEDEQQAEPQADQGGAEASRHGSIRL